MKRLLLSFACLLGIASSSRATDYTVVVFDASTSMNYKINGHARMDVAKRALTSVFSQMSILTENTQIGICVFEDDLTDPWIYPLGPFNKEKVLQAIQRPQPNGGTPLGDYMKIGADALLKAREANHNVGTYKLVIATDGEADNRDLVERYNRDIRSRGILVSVIGLGMEADHSLATQVDFYQNAGDEKSITKALKQVLAETPDTKDRPSDFIDGEFDPRLALVAFQELSTLRNQPIGEAPPVKSVDAQGNVSYTAPQPVAPPTSAFGIFLFLMCLCVVATVGLIILVIINR